MSKRLPKPKKYNPPPNIDELIAKAKAEVDGTILVPAIAKGPKPSLSMDEAGKLLADLETEALELPKTFDIPAQKRIGSDWMRIVENKALTRYEMIQALKTAAFKTGDKDTIEVARRLTNSNARTGYYEPFHRGIDGLSDETKRALNEELKIILADSREDPKRRLVNSILEEAPRKWKKSYLQRKRDIVFMTKPRNYIRLQGQSMLPTLTSGNYSFGVIVDDDFGHNSVGGNTVDWEDLTRLQAIRMVMKHHNLGPAVLHSNFKVNPIMTSDIKKDDLVAFVAEDAMGVTKFMLKRVKALEGDIVVYGGRKRTVPGGHFWAVGDNTENSFDSRHYGAVPLEHLRSKLLLSYKFPMDFTWFGN